MCIYVCMYTYTYIYIYMYTHMCVCIYIYIYLCRASSRLERSAGACGRSAVLRSMKYYIILTYQYAIACCLYQITLHYITLYIYIYTHSIINYYVIMCNTISRHATSRRIIPCHDTPRHVMGRVVQACLKRKLSCMPMRSSLYGRVLTVNMNMLYGEFTRLARDQAGSNHIKLPLHSLSLFICQGTLTYIKVISGISSQPSLQPAQQTHHIQHRAALGMFPAALVLMLVLMIVLLSC